MKLKWESDFIIEAKSQGENTAVIKAKSAGLISLANHLMSMARSEITPGYHLHLEDSTSLEPGSIQIIHPALFFANDVVLSRAAIWTHSWGEYSRVEPNHGDQMLVGATA